jgi:6-pyruvoyl-tetrahydropterin synthase
MMSRVRKHPRMSVNQLAAYMEATSAAKRRSILMDAKYPQDVMVIYYDEPSKILKQYYGKGLDLSFLESEIEKFKETETDSPWAENRKRICIKLLENVLNEAHSPLDKFTITAHVVKGRYIEIAGVGISACPDLIIKKARAGEVKTGAVKFIFSSDSKFSVRAQQIVSEILYRYVTDYITANPSEADKRHCFSFDPHQQTRGASPVSSKRLSKEIEDTCIEIAERWALL